MNNLFKNYIKNSTIIHNLASLFINLIPTFVLHNVEKYKIIRYSIENTYMDSVKGDYLEFGTLTGSSLNHAINSYKKFHKNQNTYIYTFDSYEGFPVEIHKIFKSSDYIGNFNKVLKVASKYKNCEVVKGFFKDTLKKLKLRNKIKKISIVFIDCDLAKSSIDVFKFIKPRLSFGSLLIIDDFFNVDINKDSIKNQFYKHFKRKDFEVVRYFGLQGIVFRYFKK